MIQEVRQLSTKASAKTVFEEFCSIGGKRGWHYWNWAWVIRGAFDRLIGGPGLRRGRRDPRHLLKGEALDFWRVEEVIPLRLLRLRAEMKVPGRAWLEFEALEEESGSTFTQTAYFAPKGLPGFLYWYVLYPFHRFIFSGMASRVVEAAEKAQQKKAV